MENTIRGGQREALQRQLEEAEKRIAELECQLQLQQEWDQQLFNKLGDEVHKWKLIRDDVGNIKTWVLVQVNASTLKSWNKKEEEVIGKTTNDIFGIDATTLFMPIVQKAIETQKSVIWEEYFEPTNQYLRMQTYPMGEYFISTGRDITEEKRAEKELRESQTMLQQAERVSNQGSWKWGIAEDNWSFSAIWLKIHGLSRSNLNRKELLNIFIPEDRAKMHSFFDGTITDRTTITTEGRIQKHSNGDIRWVRITADIQFDDQGIPVCMVGVTQDITSSRRAISKMKTFTQAMDHSLNGFDIINQEGTFIYVNDAYRKMFGYDSVDEILGTSPESHFADPNMPQKVISELRKNGVYIFELKAKRKDGSEFDVLMHARLEYDENGYEIYPTTSIDITKRKETEKELAKINQNLEKLVQERAQKAINLSKELELYRLAAEQANSGVWYWNIQENKLDWDDVMYKLFGISKDDFSGAYEAWETSLHPDDKERTVQDLNESIEQRKPFDSLFRVVHPTTRAVSHIRAKGKIELDDLGEVKAVYGTNWDVSREMQLAYDKEKALEELKEAQSQLILSEKMASLGVLTAGIAHEINNPLNYIVGGHAAIIQHIEENHSINKEELHEYLEWIKSGSDRATSIVKSLNIFSRSTEDMDECCDLHLIINDCLLMLRSKHRDRIKIVKDFMHDQATILGNNGRLHQAMLNLIANAIDAIPGEGQISIKTKREADLLKVSINDNGTGITSEHLQKIMDPFFTTKSPGKGTGLGLSISNSIIRDHRGSIKFDSIVGKGTTVIINLPKE